MKYSLLQLGAGGPLSVFKVSGKLYKIGKILFGFRLLFSFSIFRVFVCSILCMEREEILEKER